MFHVCVVRVAAAARVPFALALFFLRLFRLWGATPEVDLGAEAATVDAVHAPDHHIPGGITDAVAIDLVRKATAAGDATARRPPPPPAEVEPSTSTLLVSVDIPPEIRPELHAKDKTSVEQLSQAAKDWLENRVTEMVSVQQGDFNGLLEERVEKARAEMEIHLRQQIEQEMRHEVDEYRKREEESKKRCEVLEAELRAKIKDLEESEMKMKEERLHMLEVKTKLEAERQQLQKERQVLTKADQSAILNKGGGLRAPIKLKFGK
ncbi:hypothetical protein QR680_017254 [Steinernema hermaphroditum]|uniref:Uncharacterized protein n=1 Tax=Steinernema hermaphroditum TaxID=289476 RepID=A0AA39HGA4_9BILA|nr:hypothetical protein QR680_017254 [Steinernema hermaphroditum]